MKRVALLASMMVGLGGVGLGCGGLRIKDKPAKGNLLRLTANASKTADRKHSRSKPKPLVVLVEPGAVRAINPDTNVVRWAVSARVSGHLVASDTTVYVPLRGQRLLAIDRRTGLINWKVELPGEALTGLAVSEPIVVASVVDHRGGRSRVLGISAHDGMVRWVRRSDALLGAPAAVGRLALVPHNNQVVALRLHTGWDRARLELPALGRVEAAAPGAPTFERVEVWGRSLLAGQGARWVDLRAAMDAKVDDLQQVDASYGEVFRAFEGLDPGHGDGERLRLWVEFSETSAAPRSAVLMCRRAVLSMRLDPKGRATKAKWAYVTPDEREFVAMDVTGDVVTLVRDDGQILRISQRSGQQLSKLRGGEPTRGALLLDLGGGKSAKGPSQPRPSKEALLSMLGEVLLDRDPRLLPAQRLVADLLWRHEDANVRTAVAQIAAGKLRGETTEAAEYLRAYALDLVSSPWGRPDAAEADELSRKLAQRPSFLAGNKPQVAVLARRAVISGEAKMIPHLVEHLLHPGTSARELPEVVAALAELGNDAGAVRGVATFVRRYHADSAMFYESPAISQGVDFLARKAKRPQPPVSPEQLEVAKLAWITLSDAARDPFTDPALRAYIGARLPPDPGGAREDAQDAKPPQLSALSTPDL